MINIINQSQVDRLHNTIAQKDLAISALCDRLAQYEQTEKVKDIHIQALESELNRFKNITSQDVYFKNISLGENENG